MPTRLTITRKKVNHSAAAEPCVSKNNEDNALHAQTPQTDIARNMHSAFGIFGKKAPGGNDIGDHSSNAWRLFDYLQVQPKLIVGRPDDRYESEADRVADVFMRMPEPRIKLKPT
jgi:hypothetical protein